MKKFALVAAGVALVAAHAIAFRTLVSGNDATFTVDVTGPLASSTPNFTLEGTLPEAIRPRITTRDEGEAPGLRRRTWSIDYRGGFSRSAYAAQLVGPYQDPDKLACSGRITVAQSLLDDGKASEGTLAAEIRKEVTAEMSGLSVWPAGAFTKIEHISVKWARLELHPDDWAMIGKAPHGYVQVSLRIGFERVSVPMVLALIPNEPATVVGPAGSLTNPTGSPTNPAGSSTNPAGSPTNAAGSPTNPAGSPTNPTGSPTNPAGVPTTKAPELSFKIVSRADFSFDNRVLQFLNDKLGGSTLATKLARKQIDGVLLTALAPPPPFALDEKPDGQTLQFTYCDQPTEVADNKWGALPFAVMIGRVRPNSSTPNNLGAETILPPKHGPAQRAEISRDATIAIDLDLDALNAVLYELWRGGFLDAKLAEAGLDAKFNTDPTVTSLLSIRISPPRLALPPVLSVSHDVDAASAAGTTAVSSTGASSDRLGVLRMLADARIAIADGADTDPHRTLTVGRVWGGVDFSFMPQLVGTNSIATSLVQLSALDLTCERGATTPDHATLAPCYGDLVATMRERSREFDGALTHTFAQLLTDVFVERRIGTEGLPADILIKTASPSLSVRGDNASLHLDLRASLVPSK